MRALVPVAAARRNRHYASVARRGVGFLSSIVVVAMVATGCGGHGTTVAGSSTPPPAWVIDLCNTYGPQVNRTAANVSATTAGAVAESLRSARLSPTPWGSLPHAEQVARCEYPTNTEPPHPNFVQCGNHTVAIIPDTTLYFWIDTHGHRTAIPGAVLGAPCDRT
jgi:hypothetical protein